LISEWLHTRNENGGFGMKNWGCDEVLCT